MSIEDINNNPNMIKMWLDNEKAAEEQYYKDNTDSLIPLFEKELRDLGFEFETSNQAVGFIPKHKKVILPIATKYYQLAKELGKPNEQNYFHFYNLFYSPQKHYFFLVFGVVFWVPQISLIFNSSENQLAFS